MARSGAFQVGACRLGRRWGWVMAGLWLIGGAGGGAESQSAVVEVGCSGRRGPLWRHRRLRR
eukprot:9244088-Alexandrium_andersonii.AAC.1